MDIIIHFLRFKEKCSVLFYRCKLTIYFNGNELIDQLTKQGKLLRIIICNNDIVFIN